MEKENVKVRRRLKGKAASHMKELVLTPFISYPYACNWSTKKRTSYYKTLVKGAYLMMLHRQAFCTKLL